MWSSVRPRHTLWHHTSFIKFSVALLKDGLWGSNDFFFGSGTKLCAVAEQRQEVISLSEKSFISLVLFEVSALCYFLNYFTKFTSLKRFFTLIVDEAHNIKSAGVILPSNPLSFPLKFTSL